MNSTLDIRQLNRKKHSPSFVTSVDKFSSFLKFHYNLPCSNWNLTGPLNREKPLNSVTRIHREANIRDIYIKKKNIRWRMFVTKFYKETIIQ